MSIVVQINGKLRDTVQIQNAKIKTQNEIEEAAKESPKVQKYLEGKEIRKVIYVAEKLLNFVV